MRRVKTQAMKDTSGGFTIVELMITLVVASVLFAAAIPGFTDLIRNNRLASQANDFIGSLMFARTEAVKRGQRVVMCRTQNADTADPVCGSGSSWADGWAVFIDTDADGAFDTGEVVLQVRSALQGGNLLSGNNNVANRITFLPQGVVGAGGIGGFTLVDERAKPGNPAGKKIDGTRLICMGMTGRTRLVKLASAEVSADYYPPGSPLTCPAV